ncbi:MAG: acpS [Paenibacillus sp.]|nr:acpS [Paenibacillus sp.]
MIIGIGTDLTEISRIRSILGQSHGERFIERVLTLEERELAATRKGRLAEFVAGRFAAKEAMAKALGCGIGRQLGLQDMCILPDRQGKPVCSVSASAWERLGYSESAVRLHLTITHTETTAAAFAVAEQAKD